MNELFFCFHQFFCLFVDFFFKEMLIHSLLSIKVKLFYFHDFKVLVME